MKRILVLAAFICTAQFATAQEKTDTLPVMKEKVKTEKGAYITLQAGQVILVRESNAKKLEADKTLGDGTVVSVTGVIKKTDGTTIQMKEGDRVYLDGGLSLSKNDKAPM